MGNEKGNVCKWIENNGSWCDYRKSGVNVKDDCPCKFYDDSVRRFDAKYFYGLCKDFVEMYDTFKDSPSNRYWNVEGKSFDMNSVELMGYVLNDIKREIQYYERYRLDEDLNKKDILPITQRK